MRMVDGYEVGTVVMNTADGKYKGQEGKIMAITKKCYKVFLFSDKKEHCFWKGNVVEVLLEVANSERVPGRKARRKDERRCETDTLVMAFHKGLPTTASVTESEFDELVGLLKEFFLE